MARDSRSTRPMRSKNMQVVAEPLETRVLLSGSPHIFKTVADNRAKVTLRADQPLDPTTINSTSVVLFTAGPDGILGTGDDVKQNVAVSYRADLDRINIKGTLPAGTKYRVNVKGSMVKGADGVLLDGEFNGALVPSGDGTPGGNYKFQTAVSATKVARFTTVEGAINVQLFSAQTPHTVANFLSYANEGDWDNTFFHRSEPQFVIQGGGFNVNTAADSVGDVVQKPAVVNEPGIHNTRGTIAMAKLGNDPNSATNQWFFNEIDNSTNLDSQNGGFTAFGQITTANGLAVMDAISALPVEDLSGGNKNSPFTNVPIANAADAQAHGGTVDPNRDLVLVPRVAIKMDIEPLPAAAPAASAAAPSASAAPFLAASAPPAQSQFSDATLSVAHAWDDALEPGGGSATPIL